MNAYELTDRDLVRLMLDGDKEAFANLYHRRKGNVYRFALQMTGSPELAEDVTQEVFIVLMRDGAGYDESRGSVNAFLLGIARNYVLRRLKQERFFVPMDECGASDGSDSGNSHALHSQFEDLSRKQEIGFVLRAVLSLPEQYREVVVLCELQEMSYAETAQVLGCAIGTVRSRLHRARAMLIEKLRPASDTGISAERLKATRCFA